MSLICTHNEGENRDVRGRETSLKATSVEKKTGKWNFLKPTVR
jgi:hypothetical protein